MSENPGFGKIIDIDLTDRRIHTREFTEAMESLGGFGYNVLIRFPGCLDTPGLRRSSPLHVP